MSNQLQQNNDSNNIANKSMNPELDLFYIKSDNNNEPGNEKKKGYNTDYKSKGIYKKNIINNYLYLNNKSNKSNKSNNYSNVESNKKIRVNTVCSNKNINRNNFFKSTKKEEQNILNQPNTQLVFVNVNNIQQSNIQYNNINYKSEINCLLKNNEYVERNISQNNTSQNNKSKTNIPFSNINQYQSGNNNINNINQNKINIKNSIDIINNNYLKQNQNIINQSQNNHNKINNKTFNLIQNNNNNQFNNQNNQKNAFNKMNIKTSSNNYSFSRYKKAAMTGLKNSGKTSYLNSVLQLLGYLRSLSSYFLNPKNGIYFENNIDKYPLCFVLYRLYTHLYPFPEKRGREIYQPDSFKLILGVNNIVYKDNTEKDPKMLINYILDKLHTELNKEKKNKNNFNDINLNIACNRDATINTGLKNFILNNNSVIFNYFNWFELKETKCMNCNNELFSFLSFATFELNIFDCAKYRRLQSIKIENCLDFYNIPKIKKKFCYFCKEYKETTTITQIYSSPNIFIFLLNLDNNTDDEEYDDINFIIEKEINLGKFIENKKSPMNYEINGIVFKDKKRNKYVSLCLSPVDFNWYFCDDEKVELIDYDNFLEQSAYNNNISLQPCILLYKNSNK